MLNIIVAEDEVPIREWIVYSINKKDGKFNVLGAATSGKEAYDMILEHKPDVVLTDIKMPGMDGIELMQSVKKILPYTRFIVLTNYADFMYAKQAITYGASEYLLKSEIRGKDIEEALNKILEEKRTIKYKKKMDILASGYVDLYGLYQGFEEESHSKNFWNQYQMMDDKPYSVLSIKEDQSYNQREFLLEILREVGPQFYLTAIRQGIVYLIIQEESEERLSEKLTALMQKINREKSCLIGIGKIHTALKTSIKAIEEAEEVMEYAFFNDRVKQFTYLDQCKFSRLNRIKIREKYHECLNDLSLKLYDKAKNEISEWFEGMQEVHIEDVVWAKEMCLRMIISVEERFYQLNVREDEKSFKGIVTSLRECQLQCDKMISKMMEQEGLYSIKPIEIALQFIHQNYNKNISLAEVAQCIFLSSEYFSRLFKEEIGENFSVYLMMYRLSRAKELLINTDLRISEIAHEVGYGTPGYFSRIYRKYMGKSPDEERSSR